MTSNGRGEDLEATLKQGQHRRFRHKNTNRFPPRQPDSSPNPSQPQPSPGISPEPDDDYMPILEGLVDGKPGGSRHRRQMSAAYRGVEYAVSPTLKSPPIVFPRNPSPLSPQYYLRGPSHQPQTPLYDVVHLQSPTPLYRRTQAFRDSRQRHSKPAPLRLQADSPILGHWTPSPIPTTYLLDGTDEGDDSDDEFPIRPSAALLPHKAHGMHAGPALRRRLPDLLQDVLEIMNSITSQQSQLEEESLALRDMVELVVTMQEQADSLMEYSDLAEEYVDMVNDEVSLAASPSSAYPTGTVGVREDIGGGDGDGDGEEEEEGAGVARGPRELASRADSGVSVGDDAVTEYGAARVTEGRPQADAGVGIPSAPGKAEQMPRGKAFRDSGLGLMSPDQASPGKTGRGKPVPPRAPRGGRPPSGARGLASRLGRR